MQLKKRGNHIANKWSYIIRIGFLPSLIIIMFDYLECKLKKTHFKISFKLKMIRLLRKQNNVFYNKLDDSGLEVLASNLR